MSAASSSATDLVDLAALAPANVAYLESVIQRLERLLAHKTALVSALQTQQLQQPIASATKSASAPQLPSASVARPFP